MVSSLSSSDISDINVVSTFLADEEVQSLSTCDQVDLIVFCASAVLPIADVLFTALENRPSLTKTLVLCGGIGHSTQLLYDAVAHSTKYRGLAREVEGLPESRVMYRLLQQHYDLHKIHSAGLRLLIEDKSTNCGSNAIETFKLLESCSIPTPKSVIIVQDPTMSLRTLASFRKVYSDANPTPQFVTCPTFVPNMMLDEDSKPCFNVPGIPESELWKLERFFSLIMGEIPRLRDDQDGYGPKGKGFITHVHVPVEVDAAWNRLTRVLKCRR